MPIEYHETRRDVDERIPVSPIAPFPLVSGFQEVIAGFGRGSAELGIPTANVTPEQLPNGFHELELGAYFGFARLRPKVTSTQITPDDKFNYGKYLEKENGDLDVLPVVLSIGLNPFYGNKHKTVEVYVMHEFHHSFYGAEINICVLGFIRRELNYTSVEALISDIQLDIEIANEVLKTPEYDDCRKLISI